LSLNINVCSIYSSLFYMAGLGWAVGGVCVCVCVGGGGGNFSHQKNTYGGEKRLIFMLHKFDNNARSQTTVQILRLCNETDMVPK
jgi:hypothetical protein